MPRIHLPDGRIINFPDSMSAADIQSAMSSMQAPAETSAPSGGGIGRLGAVLAGAGVVGAGLLARKPALLKAGASKAFGALQGARHMGALSGLAVPKSILGNVGAPFVAAAERRSLEPIKQFFKPETVKTWAREMRNPTVGRELAEKGTEKQLRFNPMGRVMSAGDVATRGALGRAGLTEKEAARYTLQTPLQELGIQKDVLRALESKPAQYGIMYRRTPANQFTHGFNSYKDHPGIAALMTGAGAVHGGMDGAVGDPLSIAMTSPAAGVYSLPYLIGAATTKTLMGKKGEAMLTGGRGLAPIPEFGLEYADPLRPVTKPAAFSAIDRIAKLLRTGRSY